MTRHETRKIAAYAHPERLVTTEWLAEQIDAGSVGGPDGIALLESDEDVLLYSTGHIPGALKVDWHVDLNDPVTPRLRRRRAVRAGAWASAASAATRPWSSTATRATGGRPTRSGSSASSATTDVRLLDGGRAKWIAEGREVTREVPAPATVDYPVAERDDAPIRAFKDDVLAHLGKPLVDVRSPGEFSGELLHMPDYPQEGAMRGGHIPGAKSVPWARAANEDGTFKSRARSSRRSTSTEQGLSAGRRRRRLLPHRRALVAHVVRADPPARLRVGAQLRRLVDRVGQRRPRPHREVTRP